MGTTDEGCPPPADLTRGSVGLCSIQLSYGRPTEAGNLPSSETESKQRRRIPAPDRFWSKVAKGAGCWLWTASLNSAGYGLFAETTTPVKTVLAHRFAVFLATGVAVSPDRVVLHACDNRRCVNPAHLSVGTVAENNREMHDKRRHPGCSQRERDAGGRLLPGPTLARIADRYARGELSQQEAERLALQAEGVQS